MLLSGFKSVGLQAVGPRSSSTQPLGPPPDQVLYSHRFLLCIAFGIHVACGGPCKFPWGRRPSRLFQAETLRACITAHYSNRMALFRRNESIGSGDEEDEVEPPSDELGDETPVKPLAAAKAGQPLQKQQQEEQGEGQGAEGQDQHEGGAHAGEQAGAAAAAPARSVTLHTLPLEQRLDRTLSVVGRHQLALQRQRLKRSKVTSQAMRGRDVRAVVAGLQARRVARLRNGLRAKAQLIMQQANQPQAQPAGEGAAEAPPVAAPPVAPPLAVAAVPPAVAGVAEGEEGELPLDTAGKDQPARAAAAQEDRPISSLSYQQVKEVLTDIAQRRAGLWEPRNKPRLLFVLDTLLSGSQCAFHGRRCTAGNAKCKSVKAAFALRKLIREVGYESAMRVWAEGPPAPRRADSAAARPVQSYSRGEAMPADPRLQGRQQQHFQQGQPHQHLYPGVAPLPPQHGYQGGFAPGGAASYAAAPSAGLWPGQQALPQPVPSVGMGGGGFGGGLGGLGLGMQGSLSQLFTSPSAAPPQQILKVGEHRETTVESYHRESEVTNISRLWGLFGAQVSGIQQLQRDAVMLAEERTLVRMQQAMIDKGFNPNQLLGVGQGGMASMGTVQQAGHFQAGPGGAPAQ